MIQEILRLRSLGLGTKKIAQALCISKNTVKKHLEKSAEVLSNGLGLGFVPIFEAPWSGQVDWLTLNKEAENGRSVRSFWESHIRDSEMASLSCVPYVSFWREYKRRFPNVPIEFHKTYQPGQRAEADYKGDAQSLGYYDQSTNEFVQCRLYGAILCFSQLFYAEATLTEQQIHMLPATANAFTYFGGVPGTWAVDNAKTTVTRAHRYDADLNPEFQRFCEHYGTAPLAMRPLKPKDKAVIENALGVFWRWVRYDMKNVRCRSLIELNKFLHEKLDQFNKRMQRKYGYSRREKYLSSESSELLPIPIDAYDLAEWKKLKVHPDCHVQLSFNFYSVPFKHRGKEVSVRVNASIVQIFLGLECIATHHPFQERLRGRYSTTKAHLPESHAAILEATPQFIIEQAEKIGPSTHKIIVAILNSGRHPLQYLRRAQGILRLGGKRYGKNALELACKCLADKDFLLPRTHDLETIMKSAIVQVEPPKMMRNENPNLRGQKTWSKENLN
jgi:hypothetical protein